MGRAFMPGLARATAEVGTEETWHVCVDRGNAYYSEGLLCSCLLLLCAAAVCGACCLCLRLPLLLLLL
jgi:hypothetical protein